MTDRRIDMLRASEIFTGGVLTLIAVESVEFSGAEFRKGCQLQGSVRPVAVVVCKGEETYAVDMESKSVELGLLEKDVPGLGEVIARSRGV